MMKYKKFLVYFFTVASLFLSYGVANAARLYLSPNVGSFEVGGTFDVNVMLDTQGKDVNSVDVKIHFPTDKMHFVSSVGGVSIINVWVSNPTFDNNSGFIEFSGGILGGINTSSGVITKLRFRVVSPGRSLIKILDKSRVILNDGLGTDAIIQIYNGVYNFTMPPPAGPVVVSGTQPDQSKWYNNNSISLNWISKNGSNKGSKFSYVLDKSSISTPDNISEGSMSSIKYSNLESGIYYFHIKEFKNGVWGGVTTFVIHIDTSSPANFKVDVVPRKITKNKDPIFYFFTTDTLSGLDHYEAAIIPIDKSGVNIANAENKKESGAIFVEAKNPFIANNLKPGAYDFVVRAYDKANNVRTVSTRIRVVSGSISYLGSDGIYFFGYPISWYIVILILGIIIMLLLVLFGILKIKHRKIIERSNSKEIPNHIKKKLEELKRYRKKYGKFMISAVFLFVTTALLFMGSSSVVMAKKINSLAPPIIDAVSDNITNQDIMYVGGRADIKGADISIFLENLGTKETFEYTAKVDKSYEWFYKRNDFLRPGKYIVWAQEKLGDQASAPSAQKNINVEKSAFQFGSSRISYGVVYLIVTIILILIIILLATSVYIRNKKLKKKKKELEIEIKDAEDSIVRGFAFLKRDLELELNLTLKKKSKRSSEEKVYMRQLKRDLENIKKMIGKEIWEIEKKVES